VTTITIDFNLNGQAKSLSLAPLRRLLDILREDLGLTGTKEGCGEGECGACSVLLDGQLVNACLVTAAALPGRKVTTIEGLRELPEFAILSQAFAQAGAVQCGFCTPGMVMAAYALLGHNPRPTQEEIRTFISGNLCRCTGYDMIVQAISLAAAKEGAQWNKC